jgi:hypothetical protein
LHIFNKPSVSCRSPEAPTRFCTCFIRGSSHALFVQGSEGTVRCCPGGAVGAGFCRLQRIVALRTFAARVFRGPDSAGAVQKLDSYAFLTLDDPSDPTFTEITGINQLGKLCGFYGKGTSGDPSHGFILNLPYGSPNFRKKDYPGAEDTVVTSLNNKKAVAGYYVASSGIFGFIETKGLYSSYKDPHLRGSGSNITELLGINDAGLAVGFYTDGSGLNHGFELNEATGKFHAIVPPGAISTATTGINGKGDTVGYLTIASGATLSYLLKGNSFTLFSYPGSLETTARALNWQDQIVGSYVDLVGKTHGFLLTNPLGQQQWQSVDEPKAAGTTVVTSYNNHHVMVGYYVDRSSVTNGFVATPSKK